MRLVLLSTYFPPEIGSASHLFHDMGREFAKRGHDVTVVRIAPEPFGNAVQRRKAIDVEDCGC